MASKKKLIKNYRCHSGYNFSEEIRYKGNKLKSYRIREEENSETNIQYDEVYLADIRGEDD